MVPTRRLVVLAFLGAALALASTHLPAARAAVVVYDVVLVVLVALEAMAGRGRRLEIERRAPRILSVGRPNGVVLNLRNASDRALTGSVDDDPVDDADTVGLPGTFALPPGGSALLRYEIVPKRRGLRELGAVTARYALPFGLLHRQERFAIGGTFDVYPDVHAARALELLRRRGQKDARLGSLRVNGGDTEFERLRPWQRGDEVRHVDWRASARRDELVARQYQAESDQSVVFALDLGRGMRGAADGITMVDRALAATLLCADVALRGGDKVGLFTFDDLPRSLLAPRGGRATGRALAKAAYDLDADLRATDYRAAMSHLKARIRARSLVVIFTHPLEVRAAKELAAAVSTLTPRHVPLCVLFRDEEVEALAHGSPRDAEEATVRAAAGAATDERYELVRELEDVGALVLSARPLDVTPALVGRYLDVKARRLL